jgi:hypothetical protein
MRPFILLLASILGLACGSSSPTTPSPSGPASATSQPATATAALSDTQAQVMAAQMTSVAIEGANEGLDATGVITTYGDPSPGRRGPAGIALRDVLINFFRKDTVACPGGGTIVRDLRFSGVNEATIGTNHLDVNGTITYDNCVVYSQNGESVTANGEFSVTMNLGDTPSGQQSLRKNGTLTWRRMPDNSTGVCQADFSVNLFNRRDPRATGNGTFCTVAIAGPLPAVSQFPAGIPISSTTPTPLPTPTPTPEPTPTPAPTPTPSPSPSVVQFDGRYEGSYGGDASGAVRFTVANGVITVTEPTSGTGTVASSGSASFGGSLAGGDGIQCSFSGVFQAINGVAAATGGWSCVGQGSASGSWTATRTGSNNAP